MRADSPAYEALEAEVTRLRERVDQLEKALAGREPGFDALLPEERRVPYRAVFNHLPVPGVMYATDGQALAINVKNCELVSVKAETVVGRHNILEDPEAIANGYADCFKRAVLGEMVQMPPTSYDRGSASIDSSKPRTIWSETTYAPIDDASGRRFVLELNMDVTARVEAERAALEGIALVQGIIENAPVMFYAKGLDGSFVLVNHEAGQNLRRLLAPEARDVKSFLGRSDAELFPAPFVEAQRRLEAEVARTGTTTMREEQIPFADQPRHHLVTRFPLRDSMGRVRAVGVIAVDVTAWRDAEAQNRKLAEEILRVKDEALRALSTPLLPIAAGVLVLPLVGYIDNTRADQVIEALLDGVTKHAATRVIIDVTGVPVVDAYVAEALVRAARAVALLGARVILTGIQPDIAKTLIALGVDLGGIITRSTLERGVADALRASSPHINQV